MGSAQALGIEDAGGIMTAPTVQPLTLGQRIRLIRRVRGMSARVLAEKASAGLTRAVIANVECGKQDHVRSDQVLALSDALGVPLDVLLRGSDDAVLRRYFSWAVAS